VSKKYHAPATPCERLLASAAARASDKSSLRQQFDGLDPVRLLRDIRAAQDMLKETAASGLRDALVRTSEPPSVSAYLEGLSTAWKAGEVRATHRPKATEPRWWRTRIDPFEHAWPVVEGWLIAEPTVTAKVVLDRLAQLVPDAYAGKSQLRTLQRRIKTWRAEKAKDLILGKLRNVSTSDAGA
jgi:hypothetical protein